MGRGGRETTLCTELKEFFDRKVLILRVQLPIYYNDLRDVLYKIQQLEFFEEASGLVVTIN